MQTQNTRSRRATNEMAIWIDGDAPPHDFPGVRFYPMLPYVNGERLWLRGSGGCEAQRAFVVILFDGVIRMVYTRTKSRR